MKQISPLPSKILFDSLPNDALLRLNTILELSLVPYSASTLWRKCRSNEFPQPIKISEGITAWRVGDVREWQKNPSDYIAGGSGK